MDCLNHKNDVDKNWFRDMLFFEPSIFLDNVLIAWVGGNNVHEGFTDERIIQDCTQLFKKFMPDKTIPLPKKLIRYINDINKNNSLANRK